jgi:hypothetical protein
MPPSSALRKHRIGLMQDANWITSKTFDLIPRPSECGVEFIEQFTRQRRLDRMVNRLKTPIPPLQRMNVSWSTM